MGRYSGRAEETAAVWAPPMQPAAHRKMCTDCGVSRTRDAGQCGRACQFIAPDYSHLEKAVHGRCRDASSPDEMHFGPFRTMVQARLKDPLPGAQWTGTTTRIAQRPLETNVSEGSAYSG